MTVLNSVLTVQICKVTVLCKLKSQDLHKTTSSREPSPLLHQGRRLLDATEMNTKKNRVIRGSSTVFPEWSSGGLLTGSGFHHHPDFFHRIFFQLSDTLSRHTVLGSQIVQCRFIVT